MMLDITRLEQTKKVAEELANLITGPIVIGFNGNLGSGKTTFIPFFIRRNIGSNIERTSPAFT